MPIYVERSEFDPHVGYQYYVSFTLNGLEEESVAARVPVEVAVSLGENGELADFSFEVPKPCRSEEALAFIRAQESASYVEPRVYITFPACSGDTVVAAAGRLELDRTGRIVGLEILWAPLELSTS